MPEERPSLHAADQMAVASGWGVSGGSAYTRLLRVRRTVFLQLLDALHEGVELACLDAE
ncbi:hypothetical protein [Streptomyces cellulosae]|uniref:Uncharacterized protein n=1 Tax=Streptomyces cellulosae TaxID=1968 RepID=A0ABW7Y1Z7_STRCE